MMFQAKTQLQVVLISNQILPEKIELKSSESQVLHTQLEATLFQETRSVTRISKFF